MTQQHSAQQAPLLKLNEQEQKKFLRSINLQLLIMKIF